MNHPYSEDEITKLRERINRAIEKVENTSTPKVAIAARIGLWAAFNNSFAKADELAQAILNGD